MSASELYIPSCICHPSDELHPPPFEKPLRVSIMGRISSLDRLFPNSKWDAGPRSLPQPIALKLANATYKALYGFAPRLDSPGDIILRGEEKGWKQDVRDPEFSYYGVIFDHFVPQQDPAMEIETLILTLMDFEGPPRGIFFSKHILFQAYVNEPPGVVLAVPGCCHTHIGIRDYDRVQELIEENEMAMRFTPYKKWWDEWVRENGVSLS